MVKNIIIMGLPQTGKSTLLKSVLDSYDGMITGLITTEMRENDKRVGFTMGNYHKRDQINPFAKVIAHVDFDSNIKVSKYRVNISEINKQALSQWRVSFTPKYLLYLDEVGEMQMYSQVFTELAQKYLDTPNICIMTVSEKYTCNFIENIKKRDDIELIELTLENRDRMKTYILEKIALFSKNI